MLHLYTGKGPIHLRECHCISAPNLFVKCGLEMWYWDWRWGQYVVQDTEKLEYDNNPDFGKNCYLIFSSRQVPSMPFGPGETLGQNKHKSNVGKQVRKSFWLQM